jgi:large subunit ribosomal protein L44e
MKIPKTVKKYCPYCKKHTTQKVVEAKRKTRSTANPLSKGSKKRIQQRGRMSKGNKGKYSKPPITKWRMANRKTSKKTDFRYECSECKKMTVQKKGIRTKKLEFK